MLLLSREATEKDRTLTTQMIQSANQNETEKNGEQIWAENGFFFDQRADFNMPKKNFPEYTLVYVNQGTISTTKNDLAIYTNCFILGQVIPALDSPKDIDSYQCKQNETKIIVPLYDVSTGKILGLDFQLGYIVLRGDPDEVFFSYWFNAKTSKVL